MKNAIEYAAKNLPPVWEVVMAVGRESIDIEVLCVWCKHKAIVNDDCDLPFEQRIVQHVDWAIKNPTCPKCRSDE